MWNRTSGVLLYNTEPTFCGRCKATLPSVRAATTRICGMASRNAIIETACVDNTHTLE